MPSFSRPSVEVQHLVQRIKLHGLLGGMMMRSRSRQCYLNVTIRGETDVTAFDHVSQIILCHSGEEATKAEPPHYGPDYLNVTNGGKTNMTAPDQVSQNILHRSGEEATKQEASDAKAMNRMKQEAAMRGWSRNRRLSLSARPGPEHAVPIIIVFERCLFWWVLLTILGY